MSTKYKQKPYVIDFFLQEKNGILAISCPELEGLEHYMSFQNFMKTSACSVLFNCLSRHLSPFRLELTSLTINDPDHHLASIERLRGGYTQIHVRTHARTLTRAPV